MEFRLNALPDAEFTLLHSAALRLLDEFGVAVEHGEGRRLLLADNRNCLGNNDRIRLDSSYVTDVLARVPENGFKLYGRDENRVVDVRVGATTFRPSTGEPFVYDYNTRERRSAVRDDAVTLVRLTDALPEFEMVNAVVNPTDTPAGRANVDLFVISHRYSSKPSDVTVSTGIEVKAIAAIASILRGSSQSLRDRPLTAIDASVVTPLRFTPDDTEAFLEAARQGLPVEILTSPSMAISSPITIAGSTVVSAAEMIAAICLIYAIEPGLGVVNTVRISPIDMRSGAYNYGAPELAMGSVLSTAYSDRLNIPSNVYGFGTSAKAPGIQSAMEKSLGGLLIALAHPHLITGSGTLDNSLVTGPELLVIDHELARMVKRVRGGVEVSEETIGLSDFMEGMCARGSMIAEDHTVDHLRKRALVDCGLNQWQSYDAWLAGGKEGLLERAHEEVVSILAEHQPPMFDSATEGAIAGVLERYYPETR